MHIRLPRKATIRFAGTLLVLLSLYTVVFIISPRVRLYRSYQRIFDDPARIARLDTPFISESRGQIDAGSAFSYHGRTLHIDGRDLTDAFIEDRGWLIINSPLGRAYLFQPQPASEQLASESESTASLSVKYGSLLLGTAFMQSLDEATVDWPAWVRSWGNAGRINHADFMFQRLDTLRSRVANSLMKSHYAVGTAGPHLVGTSHLTCLILTDTDRARFRLPIRWAATGDFQSGGVESARILTT